MTKKEDYQAAIAALETKIKALHIAIAELKAMSGSPSDAESVEDINSPDSTLGKTSKDEPELRPYIFFGMSKTEAAKIYLQIMKRPKETREIAEGIKAGGILSETKHLNAVVHSALSRSKIFIRVGKKWGLSEWYPSRAAQKASKNGKEDQGEKKLRTRRKRKKRPSKKISDDTHSED